MRSQCARRTLGKRLGCIVAGSASAVARLGVCWCWDRILYCAIRIASPLSPTIFHTWLGVTRGAGCLRTLMAPSCYGLSFRLDTRRWFRWRFPCARRSLRGSLLLWCALFLLSWGWCPRRRPWGGSSLSWWSFYWMCRFRRGVSRYREGGLPAGFSTSGEVFSVLAWPWLPWGLRRLCRFFG